MARSPAKTAELSAGHAPRRLIIECKARGGYHAAAMAATADASPIAKAIAKAGGQLDASFAPVMLPDVRTQDPMRAGFDNSTRFDVSDDPDRCSMILVADGDAKVAAALRESDEVIEVFADLPIEPCIICPGNPPLGTHADVARLLCVDTLAARGMTGNGVLLAIVDTGINAAHLASKGLTPAMDAGRSWVPRPGLLPFEAPVGHGTMCAFDALIAAPRATLLDIQLLQSTAPGGFSGFLSDAVRAFAHLRDIMLAPARPGESRSLVVNNSWGMFHPSWDFPPGHASNYSDNPNHPFNRAVAALEAVGADILFAAGNCGADCPDGRCQGVTANAIYGANGHPSVLTIAGVDTTKARVGYSSQGPGRLSANKPDLAGYTHFSGSGVYAADGGTSAACPVVAGVVAAARSRRPFQAGNPAASPHAMRELLRSTAEDLGAAGFDFNTGFGVVNGCGIADRLVPPGISIDICRRFPWICRPPRLPEPLPDFCKRYPDLCGRWPIPFPPRPPFPRVPPIPPVPPIDRGPFGGAEAGGEDELSQLIASIWQMGYEEGAGRGATAAPKGGCGCGCGGKGT